MVKLAISGKGGVGKTTLAAGLALLLAEGSERGRGRKVLAVDADPDGSLASALGVPRDAQRLIVPIARQKALIEERTGAKVKQYGQMFRINPRVDDVADGYAYVHNNVRLLVLGAIEAGGSGCACPESVLLRALVSDLVLRRDEALIMDMEAGVEHLGRATARGVDCMIIVVEPGQRSVDSARRVMDLAGQIGLTRLRLVGNKIASPADEQYLREALPEQTFIGMIPFSPSLPEADRAGRSVLDGTDGSLRTELERILAALESEGIPISPR